MVGKKKQNGAAQVAKDAGLQVSKSACALVMATPTVALSLHLGATAPDAAARAAAHDQLVEFVRALARGAARADLAAERNKALD